MLTYLAMAAIGPDHDVKNPRFPWLLDVVAALVRVRHWVIGGVIDATKITLRSDTFSLEYALGIITLLIGVWWALFPQNPAISIFGRINTVFPGGVADPVFGCILAFIGRNALNKLAYSRVRERIIASRWIIGVWLFLFINQLLFKWEAIGTLIFLCHVGFAFMVHEKLSNTLEKMASVAKEKNTCPGEESNNALTVTDVTAKETNMSQD